MNIHSIVMSAIMFAAVMLPTSLNAQNDSTSVKKKWYDLYGFIRTDIYVQDRDMQSAVQGLMPLYPTPSSYNKYGEDINSGISIGMYSMTSRLGFKFNTKGIMGAENSYGCIEADFTAGSNCTLLYLRKAYVGLKWNKSDLLIGQTWHPLCTENIMLPTLSINIGAPYQPFSRNPQIRYTYHFLKDKSTKNKLDLIAAILYQASSTSVGPDEDDLSTQTSSNKFQNKALIPNTFLGLNLSLGNFVTGLGVDYKAINPMLTYSNYEGEVKKNKTLLHTVSGMVYGAYTKGLLNISAKAIYGSNLCEHNLIGGYAIGKKSVVINGLKGYLWDFTPYMTLSSYINVSYGSLFKGDLFAGYSQNFGPAKELNNSYLFYGKGIYGTLTTKDIYRIGLTGTYNPKNWCFGLEIQYNNAAWGSISNNGSFDSSSRVGGFWMDAAVIYSF